MDTEKTGGEGSAALSALDLTFSIDLCVEEGGGHVDLVPNGRDLEVSVATSIFEDLGGTLCKEFIIGWEPY